MRAEKRKFALLSFIVLLALTAAYAFVYYVFAANLAGNTASLEWLGLNGDAASKLTTLLTGVFGLIAAPVLGAFAFSFGLRSARSRFLIVRILSIILCSFLVVATVVLVLLFFTVK